MTRLHLTLAACAAYAAAAALPPPRLAHAARTFSRTIPGASAARAALAAAQPAASPFASIVSVADYGAVGDAATDNAPFFAAAIAAVATGGRVYVPSGQYSFSTAPPCAAGVAASICLTRGVSLVGTFETVPSHNMGQGGSQPVNGSILLPRAGRGSADAASTFLYAPEDTTVRGFSIYYPDVNASAAPVPYPYTITMVGNNVAVQDVELLNSFNGISAVGAHRHYISRVQGQPCNIGINVDAVYDIGRVEDVHWNPWFSAHPSYIGYQQTFGVGFLIARTDWQYLTNTFVFGMAIGYKFVQSTTGSCNGNFLGIGADACSNASVVVESADPWGILITNGEFTSFTGGFGPDGADHTQVVIAPSNAGAVRFVNSAFWGPSHQVASIHGTGSVGFDSCIFNSWASENATNAAALQVYGGDALVRGNEFQSTHPGGQVHLFAGARKVIVSENLARGAWLLTDDQPGPKHLDLVRCGRWGGDCRLRLLPRLLQPYSSPSSLILNLSSLSTNPSSPRRTTWGTEEGGDCCPPPRKQDRA
jgi:hypothetical protein